ncbi:unnamed protein product [Dicrocoelium dendriticum]|nr:unnamed protein product [Dicrocoelium dendriticum]
MRLHGIEITGVLLKDGNPLPLSSKQELEDQPVAGQFEDICTKANFSLCHTYCHHVWKFGLRASISSKINVPYDTVGCGFSSLIAPPNRTHVIVRTENKGSAELHNFVMELFSEWEKRRNDTNIMGFKLQSHFGKLVPIV